MSKLNVLFLMSIFMTVFIAGCTTKIEIDHKEIPDDQALIGTSTFLIETEDTAYDEPPVIQKIETTSTEYNLYRSDHYGFEIKTPLNCEFKEKYSPENTPVSLLFDCFVMKISENYKSSETPKTKNEVYDLFCSSWRITNYDACINGRESDMRSIEFKKIGENETFRSLVRAGRGEDDYMNSYYVVDKKYYYSFSMSNEISDDNNDQRQSTLESIVESFSTTY